MPRGPAWMQSLPELPYLRFTSYAGADVFLGLTFLDSTSTPVQPTTLTYRVDSLDSAQNVIPTTSVTPTGASQTIQLAGSLMQLTRQWYGRDNMQVQITATYTDSATLSTSTMQQVAVIELIAIAVAPQ